MDDGRVWEQRFRDGVSRLGPEYRAHFAQDYAMRKYYLDGRNVVVLNSAPIANLGTVATVMGDGFVGVVVEGRIDDRVGVYSRVYFSKMKDTDNYFLDFGTRRPRGDDVRVVVGQVCHAVNFNTVDKRMPVYGLPEMEKDYLIRRGTVPAHDRPVFDGIEWLTEQEVLVEKGWSEKVALQDIFRKHVKSVNAKLESVGQPERRHLFLFERRNVA